MEKSMRSLTLAILLLAGILCSPTTAQEAGHKLRIMAANISSGNLQSYPNPGPGGRIFQALDPDVVLIQEFNVNTTRNSPNDQDAIRAWVSDIFGSDFQFFREPGGDAIPNGVISRWPILESGEWRDTSVGNRDFAWARLDIPGEQDLWVVSVHLLTSGAAIRSSEAIKLIAAIRNHPVPDNDFLVIGGDFNTASRNEAALLNLRGLVDTLGPYPNDGGNPPDEDTNAGRKKPFDWVLADAELTALEVPVEVGDFTFPDGLVFDSRKFTQSELNDSFPPVQRGDSGAPMMQHMAVVRDFRLGEAASPDFTIFPNNIDFGISNASETPRLDSSVRVEIQRPVKLTAIAFEGEQAGEFRLVTPDLSQGPVVLTTSTNLTFEWKPSRSDGQRREVKATLILDVDPGAVEIQLSGTSQLE